MRSGFVWTLGVSWMSLAACGDNVHPVGEPLAHSDTLFLAAHEDDDMIFMQPELLTQLRSGAATTTVYATSAGPDGRSPGIMFAVMMAYGEIAGSQSWHCGQIELGGINVQHCRLRDRPVSLVDFGLPDGGTSGAREESLLHLIDGTVPELAANDGGIVSADSVVDVFAELLEATTPTSIETLELAGSHGRDNSSHMFVATIGLWAAARVGYSGPVTWHRGYNIDVEEPTLDGDDLSDARKMLGYYEACADHCARCGTPCPSLLPAHEGWLRRQYATDRVTAARGKLALGDRCLDASLTLADCTNAAELDLEPSGALRIGALCVTTSPTDDVSLAPCTDTPDQYWNLDSDGTLWSGTPAQRAPDMTYDHVRCLSENGAVRCGASFQTRWTLVP